MADDLVEKVARAICREKCAFMGEPPCFTIMDGSPFTFPPETCCEPGCMSEATAATSVMQPEIDRLRDEINILKSQLEYDVAVIERLQAELDNK